MTCKGLFSFLRSISRAFDDSSLTFCVRPEPCRLIDAPCQITPEMISSLNISEVIRGTISDDSEDCEYERGRFQFAEKAKIFLTIKSPSAFRLESIVQRIRRNQERFQSRFERKMKAENDHYQQKYARGHGQKLN